MELSELQIIWTQYDKKVSENIKINKQVLRQALIARPRKRLNWMQFQSALGLIMSPIAMLMFMNTVKLREAGPVFYFGIVLMITLWTIHVVREARYFLYLIKTDLSIPVIQISKRIKEMEIYKVKNRRVRYVLTALSLVALYLISHFDLRFFMHMGIPECILIILIVLALIYKSWENHRQFAKLTQELMEIEELEG